MSQETHQSAPKTPRPKATLNDVLKLRRQRMRTARKVLPGWNSLQGCGRRLLDRKGGVSVIANSQQNPGTTNIRFCGVTRCGSVWVCPECAAAVTENRAKELTSGVSVWCKGTEEKITDETGAETTQRKENSVLMLTLTYSHKSTDGLKDQLNKIRDSLKQLKEHRAYKEARKDLGIIGSVRALEVTVGEVNGWHPHVHQLEFIEGKPSDAEIAAFHAAILPIWQSVCVANGLGRPSDDRGVDLATGKTVHERIAAYVAKWGCEPKKVWGAERELTKCHTKMAKESAKGGTRYHPFALIDAINENPDNPQFFKWFLEYATAFKGQRQLVWARGLKQRLRNMGMTTDERTDEEIAQQGDGQPGDQVIDVIPPRDWINLARCKLIDPLLEALMRCPSRFTIIAFIETARQQLADRLLNPPLIAVA
jgi:Replication protein